MSPSASPLESILLESQSAAVRDDVLSHAKRMAQEGKPGPYGLNTTVSDERIEWNFIHPVRHTDVGQMSDKELEKNICVIPRNASSRRVRSFPGVMKCPLVLISESRSLRLRLPN